METFVYRRTSGNKWWTISENLSIRKKHAQSSAICHISKAASDRRNYLNDGKRMMYQKSQHETWYQEEKMPEGIFILVVCLPNNFMVSHIPNYANGGAKEHNFHHWVIEWIILCEQVKISCDEYDDI